MADKMVKPHIMIRNSGYWSAVHPGAVIRERGRTVPSSCIVLNVSESWIPIYDRAAEFAHRLNAARVSA